MTCTNRSRRLLLKDLRIHVPNRRKINFILLIIIHAVTERGGGYAMFMICVFVRV